MRYLRGPVVEQVLDLLFEIDDPPTGARGVVEVLDLDGAAAREGGLKTEVGERGGQGQFGEQIIVHFLRGRKGGAVLCARRRRAGCRGVL